MANIGPAYGFYFAFGFLVFTAGVASPLTIVVAAVAIALLGNTLAQFSRAPLGIAITIEFLGPPPVHRRVHLVRGQDLRRV